MNCLFILILFKKNPLNQLKPYFVEYKECPLDSNSIKKSYS